LNNPTGSFDALIMSKQEAYMSKYQPYQEPPNKAASSITADPSNEDELSPALCDAVEEQGKPHDGDIDLSTGKVKIEWPSASLKEIVDEQNTYCNFYQLKQLVAAFRNKWGYHIATVGGFGLHYCYGECLNNSYKSNCWQQNCQGKAGLRHVISNLPS
jgi:hypothetical protein